MVLSANTESRLVEALFETAANLKVVLDHEGRIHRFNRACELTTGYSRDEVIGKRFCDVFVLEDERSGVEEVFRNLQATGIASHFENFWKTKSGTKRLISWSNATVQEDAGRVEWILGTGVDITEIRESQHKIAVSEERFLRISESVRSTFWEWSIETQRFEYFTTAFESIYGWPAQKFIDNPRAFVPVVHPNDRKRAIRFWIAIHGRRAEVELRIVWPDGSVRWVRAEGNPSGRTSIYGTCEDVTSKVEARHKLEQSERLLAEAQEIAGLGSWDIDVEKGQIEWSAQTFALFDRDPELGSPSVETYLNEIVPEHREKIMRVYDEAVFQNVPVDYEITRHRPDGSEQRLRIKGRSFTGQDGRIRRVAGSVQDITSQRLSEEKLENQRRFLRRVMDTDPNLIFVRDINGRFILANEALAQNYGVSVEEVLGRHVRDFNPREKESSEFLATDRQVIETQVGLIGAEILVDDGLSPRWLQTTKRPIKHPETGEDLVLGISVDITRRKQVETDLVAAREQAELALKLKTEFIANVSHEIRTPLNGVMGLAELLSHTELTDSQRRHLTTLRRSAEHLQHTLNDVLDFSKLEADRMEFDSELVDVARVVEEVVDLYSSHAQECGLWLHLDVPWRTRFLVLGDRHRLRQVFTNLISNALKFTLEGGVHISIRGSDVLEIAVRDTGIGIRQDRWQQIFGSFIQGDGSTSRTFGGTGLGLAIVKRLVEAMDGTVTCQSTPGGGSTFTVTLKIERTEQVEPTSESSVQVDVSDETVRSSLRSTIESIGLRCVPDYSPIRVHDDHGSYIISVQGTVVDTLPPTITHTALKASLLSLTQPQSPTEQYMPTPVSPRSEQILVVEDNEVNRFVLSEQLKTFGFTPTVVDRAATAIELTRTRSFDLILMDVQMPEIDGLEATRRLRAREKKRTPIVAITAFATEADGKLCLAAGMDDYITKPISLNDLERIVTTWL